MAARSLRPFNAAPNLSWLRQGHFSINQRFQRVLRELGPSSSAGRRKIRFYRYFDLFADQNIKNDTNRDHLIARKMLCDKIYKASSFGVKSAHNTSTLASLCSRVVVAIATLPQRPFMFLEGGLWRPVLPTAVVACKCAYRQLLRLCNRQGQTKRHSRSGILPGLDLAAMRR